MKEDRSLQVLKECRQNLIDDGIGQDQEFFDALNYAINIIMRFKGIQDMCLPDEAKKLMARMEKSKQLNAMVQKDKPKLEIVKP
jgi:hypothetical protein